MADKGLKGKEEKAKHAGGRPTDYKPEYCEQAEKLAKLGATDKEMAEFFDVEERTINRWKNDHPEFCQSIKSGKIIADMSVADKLFTRATGYDYVEQVAFKVRAGKDAESVEVVDVNKHVPPDPTSMIFWLKNRRKADWRDKQEQEIIHAFADISDEDLRKKAADLARKLLEE